MPAHLSEYAAPPIRSDILTRDIGVSRRDRPSCGLARLGHLPGFVDAPDGFHIDEYRVDQDHWAEGYVVAAGA